MSQIGFITISEVILLLSALLAGIIVVLASVHDIFRTHHRRKYRELVRRLRKPLQPDMTIVLATHNDEKTIATTLRSIHASRYRSYAIVVVDDRSTDATKKVVRDYIKQHPRRQVRLYTGKTKATIHTRLAYIIHKYTQSIVVVLPGESVLERDTLRYIAVRFMTDQKLGGLWLGRRTRDLTSLDMLVVELLMPIVELYHKSLAMTRVRRANYGSVTRVAYQKGYAKQSLKMGDASDIGIGGVTARSSNLDYDKSIWRSVLLVGGVAIFIVLSSYWMYTAATLQSYLLLAFGWAAASGLLGFGVLAASGLRRQERIMLLTSIPPAFFVLYVYGIVYAVQQIQRAIRRSKM